MDRPPPVRDLDWDAERARAFAGEMTEIWTELLASLRQGPVVPPGLGARQVREAVALDVPDEPMAADELVAHLREAVLDYSLKSGHPAHLAYITGTGTVPGAAADLLASGLNANVGGWLLSPSATEIELQLTRWFASLLGLPETRRRTDRRGRRHRQFRRAQGRARRDGRPRDARDGSEGAPRDLLLRRGARHHPSRGGHARSRHVVRPPRRARRPRGGDRGRSRGRRPAGHRRRHGRDDGNRRDRAAPGARGDRIAP